MRRELLAIFLALAACGGAGAPCARYSDCPPTLTCGPAGTCVARPDGGASVAPSDAASGDADDAAIDAAVDGGP